MEIIEKIMIGLMAIASLILIVVLISLPFIVIDSVKTYNRLHQQCIDDGKKEYECYSLLQESPRR